MNTIYKHNIRILLATLIVALFIPNLSVVHADDDEEEDEYSDEEEEDEYSDEVIPVPPTHTRLPPGYDWQWEAVEHLQVAWMGEYDTSWFLPTWVTDIIEEYTKERNDIAHKEPCRTQSNVTVYRSTSDEISITEWVTDAGRRGFYATFDDPLQWAYAMYAYFFQYGAVVYVDSEMREQFHAMGCTHKFLVLDSPSEYIKESINAFRFAPFYYEQDWDDYHLFVRNCQHYNDWVLTGVDHSQ